MDTRRRSTPGRFTLAAIALFAAVSVTGLMDRPAASNTIRPSEVESPIELTSSDLSA
jgi:hypothetical protein